MTTPQGHEVPVQATSGATADTSTESPAFVPGFMVSGAPITDPGEALRNPYAAEVNRLNGFLMQAFPAEMNRTNRPISETPVDAAIRLLVGLGATGTGPRCAVEYCNLAANHDSPHGFVQYQSR